MSNPTDTNQASELYELCREVYERFPEWVGTAQFICKNEIFSEGEYEDYGMSFNFDPDKGHTPLYTSDYLLEKLPKESEELGYLDLCSDGDNWMARYTRLSATNIYNKADTPLKALLKLTIALSEAGELK